MKLLFHEFSRHFSPDGHSTEPSTLKGRGSTRRASRQAPLADRDSSEVQPSSSLAIVSNVAEVSSLKVAYPSSPATKGFAEPFPLLKAASTWPVCTICGFPRFRTGGEANFGPLSHETVSRSGSTLKPTAPVTDSRAAERALGSQNRT